MIVKFRHLVANVSAMVGCTWVQLACLQPFSLLCGRIEVLGGLIIQIVIALLLLCRSFGVHGLDGLGQHLFLLLLTQNPLLKVGGALADKALRNLPHLVLYWYSCCAPAVRRFKNAIF